MCWNVETLDYLCGHEKQPNHGIPDLFVRNCGWRHNVFFNRCQTVHSQFRQEKIPWLCPDCHWSIIKQGLGPLYASAIQTGQSTIDRLFDMTNNDQSMGVLALSNQLDLAIKQTQESILSSGDLFHALAAEALSDFLGTFRFRALQDEARNIDHPWRASLCHAPRNPFQRLALPETNSGIQAGWTLGPAPQARASQPPDYFSEPNNVRPGAPGRVPPSNMDRSVRISMDITSQILFDDTTSPFRAQLTDDVTTPTPTSARPTNTLPSPPPDYDPLQPWTSIDLARVSQPRLTQDTVVTEGELSDSSFEGDSPATILARELRRKKRARNEMLNLPMPNHVKADVLRIEIAELELLVWEEGIIEDIVEQLEPLIHDLNSMMRSGVRRNEQSRVLLQERIDALYERCDIINVDRASRGVPVTRRFQVGRSIRELILIPDQDNLDLPRYGDFDSTQAEDGYQNDSEVGYQGNYQDDGFQGDYQGDSEDNFEDFSAGSGASLDSDDSYRQYLDERVFCRMYEARLGRVSAQLQLAAAIFGSLHLGVQGNFYSPQHESPPFDADVEMGEATFESDSSDHIS
jgi:hypothetical protein